ncbi:MAG TPA: hypothetical protein VH740_17870 [Vicinamibacterales bacterium]
MRASIRILICVGILIPGLPARAAADWQIAPFLGITFHGETTLLDNESAVGKADWSVGAAVTMLGAGPIGVEGLALYTPGFFQQDNPPPDRPDVVSSRAFALMGNVVLATPRKWTEYGLRPYVSGGLGLLNASSKDEFNLLPVKTNLLGYNVGGGAVGFLTDRAGLRFDLRYFSNLRPSTSEEQIALGRVQLSYWNASVGVVFRY